MSRVVANKSRSADSLINGLVREPVTVQGLCAETVNLSKIRGCVYYLSPITN